MMEIRSLATTDFDTLATAFGRAFAGYEVQITAEQLRRMLVRRGFDAALSFAAFDPAGRIAAFTLNGTGGFGGIPTAYDTGTGTLPEFRGRGLAARVFEYSLPHLRAAGIRQYLLEVLQHNAAAISVYRKLGFEASREFDYFQAPRAAVRVGERAPGGACTVRPVECIPEETARRFWDFRPSWQNSFEAVGRAPADFVRLGAFVGDRWAGYAVFEPAAGDIVQIAVDRLLRRRGVGSALLGEMLRFEGSDTVKCVNTERPCDSIAAFLLARGIPPAGSQFEMIRPL